MKKILLVLSITIFFFSCRMTYKTYNNTNYQNNSLPGIIQLESGVWMDETEITNFNWCEFLYWTKTTFGKNSPEYQAVLPDTNVWIKADTSYSPFTRYYLRHPSYRDYPVVGITQKQAEAFSKWRSDRAFEYILIGSGILKWQTDRNAENYFSAEKYFNGEYLGIKPDTNHLYYPVYSLPTIKEWKAADKIHDSLIIELIRKSQKTKKRKLNNQYNFIQCGLAGVKFRKNSNTNISYTVPVYSGYAPFNKSNYQLKGNVSEWTTSPDTTIGGGWYHTRAEILNDTIFKCDTANAWTGFRNVAYWKKWQK